MPARFVVRSFECIDDECIGDEFRLFRPTIQNRWTQVRGPEIDSHQSLI